MITQSELLVLPPDLGADFHYGKNMIHSPIGLANGFLRKIAKLNENEILKTDCEAKLRTLQRTAWSINSRFLQIFGLMPSPEVYTME